MYTVPKRKECTYYTCTYMYTDIYTMYINTCTMYTDITSISSKKNNYTCTCTIYINICAFNCIYMYTIPKRKECTYTCTHIFIHCTKTFTPISSYTKIHVEVYKLIHVHDMYMY